MKRLFLTLLFLSCSSAALAAAIVAPGREKARIEVRISDIRAQVRDIDKELKSGSLSTDEYRAFQDLRTSLEAERKVLEEQRAMYSQPSSPLITYAVSPSSPSLAGVRASSEPVKTLWETGGWARFEGNLPCAGCDGIKTELTLYNDGLRFTLSERYVGQGSPKRVFESDGLWTTLRGHGEDPDATVFELDYDKAGRERHFLKLSDDEIKLVDLDEANLKKKHNLVLKRVAP